MTIRSVYENSGSISPKDPSFLLYTTFTSSVSAFEKTKKLCPSSSIWMQASSGNIGLIPNFFVRTMRISSSSDDSSSDSINSFLMLPDGTAAVGCPWLFATSLFLYLRSCRSITSSTRSVSYTHLTLPTNSLV